MNQNLSIVFFAQSNHPNIIIASTDSSCESISIDGRSAQLTQRMTYSGDDLLAFLPQILPEGINDTILITDIKLIIPANSESINNSAVTPGRLLAITASAQQDRLTSWTKDIATVESRADICTCLDNIRAWTTAETSADESPAELAERLGLDAEDPLLDEFEAQFSIDCIAATRQLVAVTMQSDWVDCAEIAHSIKGMSLNVGYNRLAGIAHQIEVVAKELRLQEWLWLLWGLDRELSRILQHKRG